MNVMLDRFPTHLLIALALGLGFSGCSREAGVTRALKKAGDYLQEGKYEEAKIECANVLRVDPMNAGAVKNLGVAWLKQGAPLRALPYLLRTVQDNPGDLEARMRIAEAYLLLDARSEAGNEAATILRDQPGNARALVILAEAARLPGEIRRARERMEAFPDRNLASFHLASGSVSIKAGDLEKGEAEIQEALRLDPQDPLPHLAAATSAVLRKRPEEAGKHYQSAAQLAPARSPASMSYAEFLLQSGKAREAGEAIKPVLKAAPDYLPARRLDAQIFFALGEKESAAKQVSEVLRQDPENLEGAILQAQLWLAEGDGARAGDLLERLNKKVPKYPTICFELARCARLAGNPDRALQILDELVRAHPNYIQAVLVLNELRLQEGQAAEAVAALEIVCQGRPDLTPANILLAQGYRALGRHSEAIAIYRRLLQTPGNQPQLTFLLGLTFREANQLEEAERSLVEAAKLDPAATAPFAQLIEIDLSKEDFAKAAQRIAERSREQTPSAELLLVQAKVEAAQKKWDQAEANCKKANELDPTLSGAYELLIRIYVATGRLAEAGLKAEALCEKVPNDIQALTTAAAINGQLGETTKATRAYERLLAAKPDSTIALNNLACIYAEQAGQLDRAYTLARKAREQKPSDAAIADTLGWISFRRKEYGQAVTLLQESSSQLSDQAEAMAHFGLACSAMGLIDKAANALEKAAALPQPFREKADLPWRIALLKSPETYQAAQLEKMGKEHPDDVLIQFRLGEKLRDAKEYARAGEAFENALRINPQAFPCVVELALLNAGPLQKPEAAAEWLRRARAMSPGDADSKLALGKVAFRLRDWSGAYTLLQDAARRSKPGTPVPLEFARAAYALGKIDEGNTLLASVAQGGSPSDKDEAQRLLALMTLSANPENPGDASVIRDALERSPDDPIVLVAAGIDARRRGNSAEAVGHFNRALQLLPDSGIVQKELAAIYLDDPAKLPLAHDLAVKARRALPNDPAVMNILAETNFRRGDFAYARQLLEESAKKGPLTGRAQYVSGAASWEMKDVRNAAQSLRQALSGDLPEPIRKDAQRILQLCEKEKPASSGS